MKTKGAQWTPELDARILALKTEGKSARETGEAVGRTRNAICGRWKRLRDGIKPKKKRPPPPKVGAYHRNYDGLRPLKGLTANDLRMEFWRRQHRGAAAALKQIDGGLDET